MGLPAGFPCSIYTLSSAVTTHNAMLAFNFFYKSQSFGGISCSFSNKKIPLALKFEGIGKFQQIWMRQANGGAWGQREVRGWRNVTMAKRKRVKKLPPLIQERSDNFTVWFLLERRRKCMLKIWRKMTPLASKEQQAAWQQWSEH